MLNFNDLIKEKLPQFFQKNSAIGVFILLATTCLAVDAFGTREYVAEHGHEAFWVVADLSAYIIGFSWLVSVMFVLCPLVGGTSLALYHCKSKTGLMTAFYVERCSRTMMKTLDEMKQLVSWAILTFIFSMGMLYALEGIDAVERMYMNVLTLGINIEYTEGVDQVVPIEGFNRFLIDARLAMVISFLEYYIVNLIDSLRRGFKSMREDCNFVVNILKEQ